jgi:hypothetical protein
MARWRLYPVANPDDPRWQGRTIWPELVVEAESAAIARQVAAQQVIDPGQPPVGNETRALVTGFEDEKLYWAEPLPD